MCDFKIIRKQSQSFQKNSVGNRKSWLQDDRLPIEGLKEL